MNVLSFPMSNQNPNGFYTEAYANGVKIKPDDLTSLGYRFTARFISLGGNLKLYELLPLRSDQPADACFVAMNQSRGVIIRETFHHHKSLVSPMNALKSLASKTRPKEQVNPQSDKDQRQEAGSALAKEERNTAALNRGAFEY